MLGVLILIIAGTSLLLPGISSAQDGETSPDEEETTCQCQCMLELPPLPAERVDKGFPETSPEGKAALSESIPGS